MAEEFDESGFVKDYVCQYCNSQVKLHHTDDIGTKWFLCAKCKQYSTKLKSIEKTQLEEGLLKNEGIFKPTENKRDNIISFFDSKYLFYCDRFDPDLTLYVWIEDAWQPIAEGIFLKDLADFEELFKEKPKISKDGLMDYFRGKGQNTVVEDQPSHLIAFKNGLYNLETEKLEPHNQKYFVVNIIPHNFNPNANHSKWTKFLNEVHHQEDLDFIQEWWGFNLTTSYLTKGFVVMLGVGDNGKSVELSAIEYCLGHKNVTNVTMQNLNNPNGYHLATLHHRLANIADDIPANKIRIAGNLKIASDGGWLNARPIYGHPFDFENYAKITNSCNEPPEIEDESDAIWTRLKIVEFPYSFKAKPDQAKGERKARPRDELDRELAEEAEGILNWMAKGLLRLKQNKYRFSYNVSTEAMSKFYKIKSNPIRFWLENCLEYTADEDDMILKREIFPLFREWCRHQQLKRIPSSYKFFQALRDAGIEAVRPRELDRERVYIGYSVPTVPTVPIVGLHLTEKRQTKLDEEKNK